MIYNDQIKFKVLRIFGENSEIYSAFKRGEKVSMLIRKTYNQNKRNMIRDKIILYNLCKQCEREYDEYSKYLSI